jgi:hypothetical protein
MSRENSSPSARLPIFLGIQPNRLKEWSSSGGKVLVFAYEAEKQFFFPVVPFCCDGANLRLGLYSRDLFRSRCYTWGCAECLRIKGRV